MLRLRWDPKGCVRPSAAFCPFCPWPCDRGPGPRPALATGGPVSGWGWCEGPGIAFCHERLAALDSLGRNIPVAQGSQCCSLEGDWVAPGTHRTPHTWRVRRLSVCRLPSLCPFTHLCFSVEQEVYLAEPGHGCALRGAGAVGQARGEVRL